MQVKHAIFICALACAGWALFVSGISFIDDLSKVQFPSELPRGESPIDVLPDQFNPAIAILNTLNLFLPVGLLCFAILVYIYPNNPISPEFLGVGVAIFALALHTTLKAGVRLDEAGFTHLSEAVWWM